MSVIEIKFVFLLFLSLRWDLLKSIKMFYSNHNIEEAFAWSIKQKQNQNKTQQRWSTTAAVAATAAATKTTTTKAKRKHEGDDDHDRHRHYYIYGFYFTHITRYMILLLLARSAICVYFFLLFKSQQINSTKQIVRVKMISCTTMNMGKTNEWFRQILRFCFY